MTKDVFVGFKKACPEDKIIKNDWVTKRAVKVPEHSGDVVLTTFKE
jgi:hypothetical protein